MQTESALISDALPISPHKRWMFSRRFWLTCLAATPALLPLFIFFNYHVDFIWNDAWDMAGLLVKSHEHTLRFADFWAFHNEHRMPIPYFIMFVLATLTHWNMMAELLFGYAMVCVLSALLAILLRRSVATNQLPLFPWFLINMLIFSPSQGENWGFGFAACQNFIPLPCILGAAIVLSYSQPNWKAIAIAALLVEIAALSITIGLLGWLLMIPILISWPPTIRAKKLAIWIGLIFISLIVQFWGYHSYEIQSTYYTASVLSRLGFFFAFLGNPLVHSSSTSIGWAIGVGVILFLAYGYLIYRCVAGWTHGNIEFVRKVSPWMVLGAYAIGSALLGASGRAGSGIQQATTGRYTTIAGAMLICLIGVANATMKDHRRFVVSRLIICALLLVAMLIGAFRANNDFAGAVRSRRAGAAHLTFVDLVFEPYARFLVGVDEHLQAKADVLNEMGYVRPPLIKNPNIALLADPKQSVDASHGTVEGGNETVDGNLQIWGWSILPDQRRALDIILITVDDEKNVPRLIATGQTGSLRQDVADSLGNDFRFSGWRASFPISRLPTGGRLVRCWGYDGVRQKAYLLPGLAIRTVEK